MTACARAVNRSKADLGIVVDTDVDRSAVVGSNGAPINSNRYIALMASIALRHPPAAVSLQGGGETSFWWQQAGACDLMGPL